MLAVDGVSVVEELAPGEYLLAVPRYEPFTAASIALARNGARFREVAGNRRITLTVVAPEDWARPHLWGSVVRAWPILTEPGQQRVALEVPLSQLHTTVAALDDEPVRIDHVYDY